MSKELFKSSSTQQVRSITTDSWQSELVMSTIGAVIHNFF